MKNENLTQQEGNKAKLNAIKSLPPIEELDKKLFFPLDKEKDDSARVGAKWLRHFLLGELNY